MLYLLMYLDNMKDEIAVPSHNYITRLKMNYNVIVPKMRTIFGQHYPTYTIMQFFTSHSIDINSSNDFNMYVYCNVY